MINSGKWVQIRANILEADQRASGIPEDTASVPLVMWVKGHLTADAEIGELVLIKTITGRIEQGILEEAEPAPCLGYGDFIPEISEIGSKVRSILFGGTENG